MNSKVKTTRNIFKLIGNFFFPKRCIFCGNVQELNAGDAVCDGCTVKIRFCAESVCCEKCGKPIVTHGRRRLCYFCLNTKPKYYDRIVSVFEYEDVVKESVQRFKMGSFPEYFRPYADYMREVFMREYGDIAFDFMCAAPSHRPKGYEIGKVEQICEMLSKEIKIPFRRHILKKICKTRKQKDLNYRERQKNLQNSMVAKSADADGRVILLVDDVCTTRATVIECSRALKAAGAKRVYVLSFATTVKRVRLMYSAEERRFRTRFIEEMEAYFE